MSQPAPKADKTRTRGRASSLSGATATTGASPGKRDSNMANAQAITPTTSKSKKGNASVEIEITLAAIKDRLDCLDIVREDVATIKQETVLLRKQHAEEITQLTAALEESREQRSRDHREMIITKHELSTVQEVNKRLAAQLNTIENRMRVCNVRIDGVREDDREDIRQIVLDMAATMGARYITNGDIVSAHRTGRKPLTGQDANRQRVRTILVTFTNAHKRNNFYFARTKLRDNDRFKGVYVNDDVTSETRRQREEYRSVAAIARADGVSVRVHSDGIVLNDTKHLFTEPHTLPGKYSIQAAKTVKHGGEIYFASEHSYLSNFFSAHIVIDSVVYPTAEHAYQAEKCKMANDSDRWNKVIKATSPLEAKRIADGLTETPEWRNKREEIMKDVIDCKFDQNADLAKKLMATGTTPLNEATRNSFFGIGVNLHAREINDKSYRGQNKLGHILANKRVCLLATINNE